jgi:serine/threonine-protein kinase HipA
MPSEPEGAYVWTWLPGATEPVVAGRIERSAGTIDFYYGESYLARDEAVPIYEPELPLREGRQRPLGNLTIAGCINDAGPDAWGQRVILHRVTGRAGRDADLDQLGTITYLLESGSDRIGALAFQRQHDVYEPRLSTATLEEMVDATARLDAGEPFSPELDRALQAGSTLGGARPKVTLTDGSGRMLIAKLSQQGDPYPVVKAEGVAMDLARRVGLNVAATEVIECLGRDVLLVERFDRTAGTGARRMLVSAMTVFGADEYDALKAGYWELADIIRERFTNPDATLRELFSRIVFNICVSNTDDHARNHAAFWDGRTLTLTPAYDICPQLRTGGEAQQALAIRRDGWRYSQFAGCLDAADIYHLGRDEARDIINRQRQIISEQWDDAADAARLTRAERAQLRKSQILNPYATYDWT